MNILKNRFVFLKNIEKSIKKILNSWNIKVLNQRLVIKFFIQFF